jgi:hypothetical protein
MPDYMVNGGRGGMVAYQNEEIAAKVASTADELTLWELVKRLVYGPYHSKDRLHLEKMPKQGYWHQLGTADDLQAELETTMLSAHRARNLFPFGNSCGRLLGILIDRFGESKIKKYAAHGNVTRYLMWVEAADINAWATTGATTTPHR